MQYKKKQDIWAIEFPKGTFKDADAVLQKLKKFEFQPIDDVPDTEQGKGFVPFMDPYATLDEHGIIAGTHLAVVLRTDTRKIDKKGAKTKLEKEIRKSGKLWSRTDKKDRLEQITFEMLRHAVPVPSFDIISFTSDGNGDYAYLPVNSEKKMTAMLEYLDEVLDTTHTNDFLMENDPERGRIFLTNMWLKNENGHFEHEFVAKSLSDEENTMTSSDSGDLAFGYINGGKLCSSGTLVMGEIAIDLKASSLNGMRIHLNIEAPEKNGEDQDSLDAEMLGMQIGLIHDTVETVNKIFEDQNDLDVAGMKKTMGNMVKTVLHD